MADESCGNCHYYQAIRVVEQKTKLIKDSKQGFCRRYPPQWHTRPDPNEAVGSIQTACLQPMSEVDKWCGEWKVRPGEFLTKTSGSIRL